MQQLAGSLVMAESKLALRDEVIEKAEVPGVKRIEREIQGHSCGS